jgi:mono/diheme cytochrome c family protein
MKRILIIFFSLLLLVVIVAACYVQWALPNVGTPPELKVEVSPERIQRGQYLANHVAACMDCHSTRDWSRFSGPLTAGALGKGGEYFGPEMGFPGKFYSKNLTPAHLGNWTDGEVFRAITSGVNKDGDALFPVMPYSFYAKMDKEDILDIIAYLRSLSPIINEVPASEADFPMNFIINTLPKKPNFAQRPDRTDTVAYGGYLVMAAACMECHTPVDKGQLIVEKAFSGGRVFELPGGTLRSANITSDEITGIGAWTESLFIERFKMYGHPENLPPVKPEEYNTVMPWSMYAGMERNDLKAIYVYLKNLPAIQQQVVKYTPRK